MRGKRTYRKEFQFVGNGIIWRIYDSFGSLIEKGKEKNQREARRVALDAERKLPQTPVSFSPPAPKWGNLDYHNR